MNNLMFVVLLLTMQNSPSEKIPVSILGHWNVGAPYRTPGPIGINAVQEKFIRGLHLVYMNNYLHVCGKEISTQPINTKSLTENEFLQSYGFLPHIIGMESLPVTDLKMNPSNSMNACGVYQNPGMHLLIDAGHNVVMEVANDYFPLKKSSSNK